MGLKHNFFYNALLTGTNYIFPLIVYPYISRVLGVGNIGLVNFIDSIINYFILFSMMGLTIQGTREVASVCSNRKRLDSVYSSILTLNSISTFIMLTILIAVTLYVPRLREQSHFMMAGGVKLISNLFLIEWFYRGIENFKFITIRSIALRCLYVVSVFIFVRGEKDVLNYYVLTCILTLCNAVVNIFYSRKYVSYRWKDIHIKPLLSPFFIMGLYMVLTSMYTTFNITYLGFISGNVEVGYYTTASKLYSILIGFFTAFSTVMLPRMSALIYEGKTKEFFEHCYKSYELLVSFSIPIIIGVFLFTPEIVFLISGPGYEGAILPMRIIIPLIFIIGYEQIVVVQILMSMRKDRVIFVNSLISAIVGIIANIVLVYRLGAVGSAIVWTLCEVIILVLSLLSINKLSSIRFNVAEIYKTLFKYLPLVGILLVIKSFAMSYILLLIIGCIVSLFYMIIIIKFFTPVSNPLHEFVNKIVFRI